MLRPLCDLVGVMPVDYFVSPVEGAAGEVGDYHRFGAAYFLVAESKQTGNIIDISSHSSEGSSG